MAVDIYTIPDWGPLVTYRKNDIVTNGGKFYYSTVNHISDPSDFNNDLNQGKWGGNITFNGEEKPFFIWKPSYNYSATVQPNVKTIRFGDGYSQDVKDGINNILLVFDFNFENRDLKEYSAILHFLHSRAGYEKFFFIPPQPYGVVKKFICKEWTPSQQFIDNYSIRAKFEERAL